LAKMPFRHGGPAPVRPEHFEYPIELSRLNDPGGNHAR
jgi:hypothetical protein